MSQGPSLSPAPSLSRSRSARQDILGQAIQDTVKPRLRPFLGNMAIRSLRRATVILPKDIRILLLKVIHPKATRTSRDSKATVIRLRNPFKAIH